MNVFKQTDGKAQFSGLTRRKLSLAGTLAAALMLSACYGADFEKQDTPIPGATLALMSDINVDKRDPIFVRIFKKEAELEVWKQKASGKFIKLKTYEICSWSGELGPKFKEGDRQSPEGFYTVSPAQLNPNSSFHLSFNIGFPNAYDESKGRTGSFLMVHGACSSAGCYSMEDSQIEEIYSLAREAFIGGQKKFQVHAFPFRMTSQNMALFQQNKHMPFWRTLKRGYEHFELTKAAPKVDACNRGYVFNAKPEEGGIFNASEACPAYEVTPGIKTAVDHKINKDRILENRIAATFKTPRQRRHAELVTRLQIENDRIERFSNRGLGYSSHLKRRVTEIKQELVALGYNKDGSPIIATPQTGTTQISSPPVIAPKPRARPSTNTG